MVSKPKNILIVDDEAPHRMLAKRALKALPEIAVIEADSVHRAISTINRDLDKLSLAVVDFNLAGNPGLEIVALLRSFRDLGELPVIILSTSTLDADVEAGYLAGANCYMFKAAEPNQFTQELQSAVRHFLKVAAIPAATGVK